MCRSCRQGVQHRHGIVGGIDKAASITCVGCAHAGGHPVAYGSLHYHCISTSGGPHPPAGRSRPRMLTVRQSRGVIVALLCAVSVLILWSSTRNQQLAGEGEGVESIGLASRKRPHSHSHDGFYSSVPQHTLPDPSHDQSQGASGLLVLVGPELQVRDKSVPVTSSSLVPSVLPSRDALTDGAALGVAALIGDPSRSGIAWGADSGGSPVPGSLDALGDDDDDDIGAFDDIGGNDDEDSDGEDEEDEVSTVTVASSALSGGGGRHHKPHRPYWDCSSTRAPERPNLYMLPLGLPRNLAQSDIFIHQANHDRILKGVYTIYYRNVPFLPVDGEAIGHMYSFGSCAVVGNSGELRLAAWERAIDSHDVVMRVNQAPTGSMYRRHVGGKTTFRLMNRLWTAHYGSGRFVEMNLPIEHGLTIIITRSTGRAFDKMHRKVTRMRPDVKILYLSSRVISAARRLLVSYRVRLCEAGYGPFLGGNTPSSGYVAIYFLRHLCKAVTVYGFGSSKIEGVTVPYHYYQGVGSRKEGDPVHSFATEEALVEQMAVEGHIKMCRFKPGDTDEAAYHNRYCGASYERGHLHKGPMPSLFCAAGAAGVELERDLMAACCLLPHGNALVPCPDLAGVGLRGLASPLFIAGILTG
eukprot:jgi/Mesvir1/20246/Mv13480-RA.1